jgi:hypothetical protein
VWVSPKSIRLSDVVVLNTVIFSPSAVKQPHAKKYFLHGITAYLFIIKIFLPIILDVKEETIAIRKVILFVYTSYSLTFLLLVKNVK